MILITEWMTQTQIKQNILFKRVSFEFEADRTWLWCEQLIRKVIKDIKHTLYIGFSVETILILSTRSLKLDIISHMIKKGLKLE